MNRNDRNLDHYAEVLALIRAHAATHARRHIVLLDSHVPSGGLVREGQLLLDFHSFPLRIKEVPERPQEAILELAALRLGLGTPDRSKRFPPNACQPHLGVAAGPETLGLREQPEPSGA